MKKIFAICLVFIAMALRVSAQNRPGDSARILLIPLDDRPPCLQFTQRVGQIGNTEVVSPPKELLGKFTTPGQSDKIISWLKKQNLKSFDAAIIAIDMIAYGGLVASRVNKVSVDEALKRMGILHEIKKRTPGLLIYAQNVIMRIAPTGDSTNEAYRAKLAQWGEVSVKAGEQFRNKTIELERQIPKEVLRDYKLARERNLKINLQSVEMVKKGIIDYLILSQDDAKPQGVHVADREALVKKIKKFSLENRIAVQPGADEVSMLLLARAVNKRFDFSPRINVVYSSEKMRNAVMPYEDKPLHQTVSYHIKATGSLEVDNAADADILFYVFASRFEPGNAAHFADEIEDKIREGRQVIVADIDSRGNVQGGDTNFTMALLDKGLFPHLNGYASWNTAANTIGTALPQGIIFTLAKKKLLQRSEISGRILTAQQWFTFHRVLDDYYYHNVVRAKINQVVSQTKAEDGTAGGQSMQEIKALSIRQMTQYFHSLGKAYFKKWHPKGHLGMECVQPSGLQFDLPWNRTFEAEINFDMECHPISEN